MYVGWYRIGEIKSIQNWYRIPIQNRSAKSEKSRAAAALGARRGEQSARDFPAHGRSWRVGVHRSGMRILIMIACLYSPDLGIALSWPRQRSNLSAVDGAVTRGWRDPLGPLSIQGLMDTWVSSFGVITIPTANPPNPVRGRVPSDVAMCGTESRMAEKWSAAHTRSRSEGRELAPLLLVRLRDVTRQ